MAIKLMFTKAYLYILIAFVAVMVCFGIFIYHSTAQTMKTQLGNKCIGIATSVAVLLEDNIDDFIAFSENLNTESDYYKMIYPKLRRIRKENTNHIAFLYVERRLSDTEMIYILDSEHQDDPLFSKPGDTDILSITESEAYRLQSPFIADKFITNDYGTLLTCYAPLKNPSTGELIGLVGVDVSIDQYNKVMHNQFLTITLSIGLLILLLSLSLIFSSTRMESLASRDNLTGAYNKTYFMSALRHQLKYSKRTKNPITVLMADLDYFKNINDRYGHVFGDTVLKTVSEGIKNQLRKKDCLSRYGGEEFVAYLPDTNMEAGTIVAERIRLAMENMRIYNEENKKEIQITISIGLAQLKENYTAQDIITYADKALYKAKHTRNAVSVYMNDSETT